MDARFKSKTQVCTDAHTQHTHRRINSFAGVKFSIFPSPYRRYVRDVVLAMPKPLHEKRILFIIVFLAFCRSFLSLSDALWMNKGTRDDGDEEEEEVCGASVVNFVRKQILQ